MKRLLLPFALLSAVGCAAPRREVAKNSQSWTSTTLLVGIKAKPAVVYEGQTIAEALSRGRSRAAPNAWWSTISNLATSYLEVDCGLAQMRGVPVFRKTIGLRARQAAENGQELAEDNDPKTDEFGTHVTQQNV